MDSQIEQNKQNTQDFYDMMFNDCRPREAVERNVGDGYIQHNPEVGDGKVVEHWDVLQVIPEKSANENSMF